MLLSEASVPSTPRTASVALIMLAMAKLCCFLGFRFIISNDPVEPWPRMKLNVIGGFTFQSGEKTAS